MIAFDPSGIVGMDGAAVAAPEIAMGGIGLLLLLLGVFMGDKLKRGMSWIVIAVFAAIGWFIACNCSVTGQAFAAGFITNPYIVFVKILLLGGAIMAVATGYDYANRNGLERFEYPLLILFATLGMLLMVSANDFLTLYLGLELQSLSLYVLAAFQRDSTRSSEAGLKYFVLGALASGILLYGITLVYGFAGTTQFGGVAQALTISKGWSSVVTVAGLVFILSGLLFKVAAVPFHMWAPDVYQGAPTSVTTFFAAVPKVAAFAILIRVAHGPFSDLAWAWCRICYWLALGSMLVGAFAALAQSNLKRLMAYSSIGHVGYALIGLAAATEAGVHAILVYLAIYVVMSIGAFGVILCLARDGKNIEGVEDLAGLSRTRPLLALSMALFMFSLAGVPPLAGFMGKFLIFKAAIDTHLYLLAVIGVLTSAVSAYYYLRIIKTMYFDPAKIGSIDPVPQGMMRIVLTGCTLAIVLFLIDPQPLLAHAQSAAAALFAN